MIFSSGFRALWGAGLVLLATLYAISLGSARVVNESGILFDIAILGLMGWSVLRIPFYGIQKSLFLLLIFWLAVFFLYTAYFYSLNQSVGVFEYFRSIRFLVYMIGFILVLNTFVSDGNLTFMTGLNDYKWLFRSVLVLFVLSYLYRFLIQGNSRPWLFSENNFEMAMLIGFSAVMFRYYEIIGKRAWVEKSIVMFITFMSLSKSALLQYVFTLGALLRIKSGLSLVSVIIAGILAIFLVGFVFMERVEGGNIENIDRFLFLMVFWDEMSGASWFEWLFGHGPARNISNQACVALKFWADSMFKDATYCNAVLFHSLFMRLIYEYGFVFTTVFMLTWLWMLVKWFGFRMGFILFGIVSLNSLSVSGFSNPIVIWPFFFMMPFGKILRR